MSGRSARTEETSNKEDVRSRDIKTAQYTSVYMRGAFSFYPTSPVQSKETERDFDIFASVNSKIIDWLKKENVHGSNAKKNYGLMSIAAHDIAEQVYKEYGENEDSPFSSLAAYETVAFACIFAGMGRFGKFIDDKKKGPRREE